MNTRNLKQSKIGTVFLTVFLIAFGMTSCEKPTHQNEDGITEKDIIAMKENHIIPLKDAVKSYKKYGKERAKILKDTLKKKYGDNFSDSRTVWFDITTIKAYLKYIEETSPDSIEGLQFYFTVDLENQGDMKNHQAFFVAPTKKNGNIQSGFTLVDGKVKYVNEALKEYQDETGRNVQKGNVFNMMLDHHDEGLLLNFGTGSPPNNSN